MARPHFCLFESHLDLAHKYWQYILHPGDLAIDATCGNGHDTLVLCQAVADTGFVYGFDVQEEAIASTKEKLDFHHLTNYQLLLQSHAKFPEQIKPNSVKLAVYNLGYLPGGNKALTTSTETTLESLIALLPLIQQGGCISITCYPGHTEGKREEERVLQFAEKMDKSLWSCCSHRWLNRRDSPSLLLIQKYE